MAPVDGQAPGTDELPGALPTMWRSLRRAYDAEPRLVVVSLVMAVVATVPDALLALWLMLLADGVLEARPGLVVGATAGVAVSAVGTWVLRLLAGRIQRTFRLRVGVALETHVATLQASVPTIEHHERPEYLDRLSVLRDAVYRLDHMYASLFSTLGALVTLVVTLGLLVGVHPAMVLLTLFAVPTVVVSSWRSGVLRRVEERATPHRRLARHLFVLGTSAGPAKELRVYGGTERVLGRWREAVAAWYRATAPAHWGGALWQGAAWGLFALAYAGAVAFAAYGLEASPGQVLLVVFAGSRLGQYVANAATEADFLRMWLDASRRLGWLEAYASQHAERADAPAPDRLREGVRLEGVSFRYPGTGRWVLRDVDLALPAGSVVAVVGDNGAGKSTLVKLLCRYYEPTAGRLTVDGVDLARVPVAAWRARLAGAFQDFARFELRAWLTVGLGDVDRREDAGGRDAAARRAGATDVLAQLPGGWDTQLGAGWPGGVEPSFGQWQRLALARGFMREAPLLTILDEPTAAVDAETEHALFERYAEQGRAAGPAGGITVLVSHRFSTVRMADLIVVLEDSRVTEVGSHEELMAAGGTYAGLYRRQAAAYR